MASACSVVGRNEADLAALATEVPGVTTCVADIADDSAIEAIGAALDGPVRMAVFAAGLPIAGSVETVAPGDLARGADIKLGGLLRLVRAVDSRLVPGSRIVMFAGSLGFEPKPSSAGPGAINAGGVQPDAPAGRRLRPPRDHHSHPRAPVRPTRPGCTPSSSAPPPERGDHRRGAVGVVRRQHLAGPAPDRPTRSPGP